jgi:carbon storage regulator
MLVLSRQRDETIMIGDDIEITVVDIRGDKVRLGITAPATIPVHRKEVYEAIQRENREAAKVKMEDLPNLPGAGQKPAAGGEGKIPMRPGRPASIPITRPPNGTAPKDNGGSNPPSPPQAASGS